MKKCPYCAEEIQDEAIICRYCHSRLDGGAVSPAYYAVPELRIAHPWADKLREYIGIILVLITAIGLFINCFAFPFLKLVPVIDLIGNQTAGEIRTIYENCSPITFFAFLFTGHEWYSPELGDTINTIGVYPYSDDLKFLVHFTMVVFFAMFVLIAVAFICSVIDMTKGKYVVASLEMARLSICGLLVVYIQSMALVVCFNDFSTHGVSKFKDRLSGFSMDFPLTSLIFAVISIASVIIISVAISAEKNSEEQEN